MCLLVVDPRLLVRALRYQDSEEAKLLSLLIYGLACVRLRALRDEYDELDQTLGGSVSSVALAKLRAHVQRQHARARWQKAQIEHALEQHVSTELLLVTSPPLRQELRDIARAAQADGNHVRPDRVNREIARCTWRSLTEMEPPPPYLARDGVTSREYLIHTAVIAEAQTLITHDEALALPGNASHCDPKTRRSVRPCTVGDFCQEQLPSQLEFDAIDARAVFRAARTPSDDLTGRH